MLQRFLHTRLPSILLTEQKIHQHQKESDIRYESNDSVLSSSPLPTLIFLRTIFPQDAVLYN
ncbi:hypothetical protein EVA_10023 [gut metagenome]|uniref:Uncharacterized protein n=1 Tax=gut metagenome TaxID=749906 RepID=J9G3S6_9ZZZZ